MKPNEVVAPKRFAHLNRDSRGYPIISVVERSPENASFGSINERRKLALAAFDWCGICGLPFRSETRWQALISDVPGDLDFESIPYAEAPSHEVCLFYAIQVCPFLANATARLGDEYRKGDRRGDEIRLLSFRTNSVSEVRRSELQPDSFVLHYFQEGVVENHLVYKGFSEISLRYSSLLSEEGEVSISRAEDELVSRFNERDEAEFVVPRSALIAGAAFAPQVHRLQGLSRFDRRTYQALAGSTLEGRTASDVIDDEAHQLAAAWLEDKNGSLPASLLEWRRRGERRFPASKRPEGPGRKVGKKSQCPCGSGRKAGRCHPAGIPVE